MNRNPDSNNRNRIPQRYDNNNGKGNAHKPSSIPTAVLGLVLVCAVLVAVNFLVFSNIITDNPVDEALVSGKGAQSAETVEKMQEDKAAQALKQDIANNFIKISVNEDDTKAGNLILVNNSHAYKFDSVPSAVKKSEAVTFYGRQSDSYYVSYPSKEKLVPEALEKFNLLADDVKTATGISNLLVENTFRSYEKQQAIYEEKGPEIATVPGHSEHHTCLAFDMGLFGGGNFDGTGDQGYVAQNCHKYGWILRYPEDKVEVTGISYEPWHFRYVGTEHATFMKQNNLCLEEYIELLSKYPLESARIHVTSDSGEKYMIYSQAVSGTSGEIYVPKSYPYTLSGDNNGHVIVSCLVG